jgi:GT2 family glycosyltransferase
VALPEITVVVPTRDRPDRLARCLATLDAQTARQRLEVVVVDDSPSRSARSAADPFRGWRVLSGKGHGAAAARNLGAAAARAPLILFTDDDCEPSPVWAAALASALRDAAVAAGPTISPAGENRLGVASQRIVNYLSSCSADEAGFARFAPSNNLGCRAEVMERLPFDPGYPCSGGEDRDWCARLVAAGGRIALVADAVVQHRQQLDLRGFWRKHTGYGRGARIFHRRHAYSDMKRPGAFHSSLIGAAFRQGPAIGGLVCLAQLATALGFARQGLTAHREARP